LFFVDHSSVGRKASSEVFVKSNLLKAEGITLAFKHRSYVSTDQGKFGKETFLYNRLISIDFLPVKKIMGLNNTCFIQ